jgi:hypothetical protein
MLSRPVRALGHIGAVVLLSGTALLATEATGSAAAPSRPDSYGGDATASALHFQANRKPGAFPAVADPFDIDLPYANTSLDSSGGAEGIASPVYPGQGILGVPALICVFAGPLCKQVEPPDYPLWAYAQYPANKDAKAQVSADLVKQGPVQATPGSTTAHADPDRVEATTSTGAAGVAAVMGVAHATAHSLQRFAGSTLVLTTESTVTGVDVVKVLHIDSIRSVATARVDGGKVSAAKATTTVSGATLGGVPVVIDSRGIHAAGQDDNGAVTDQVNTALKALRQAGVQVQQLGSSREVHHGAAAATTGGMLIRFDRTVDLPKPPTLPCLPGDQCIPSPPSPNGDWFGTITLAGAGVDAFATPASPTLPFGLPAPAAPTGAHQPTGSGAVAAAAPPADPTLSTPLDNGGAPDVATGAAPAQAPQLAGFDVTGKRMKTLALVLLAYPLLVLIGRPLRAPSRLPRSG